MPGVVSLLAAVAPFAVLPFMPAGRDLNLAIAIVLFGSLLSPLNFIFAILLTRTYARRSPGKAAAATAAVFSGINSAIVALVIVLICRNGIPC